MNKEYFQLVWSEQRIPLLVVFSTLLLNLLVFVVFLDPAEKRNVAVKYSLLEVQENIRNKNADLEKRMLPHRKFQSLEQDIAKFRELLPAEEQFPVFLKELYNIAAKSELGIDSVSYRREVIDGANILSYGLTFSLQGSYDQIRTFIRKIEDSSYLIAVTKLGLTTGMSDGGSIDFSVGMKVYFSDGGQG